MTVLYMAYPMRTAHRKVWCVYRSPIANSRRPVSRHPGPFGKTRAERRAAKLNREAGR